MKGPARIVNLTRGTTLASEADIAVGWWERTRGLLGRRSLPPGGGLVIRPCNGVHCLGMAFPIDVIYLDGAGEVLRLLPALRPNRLGPLVPAAREVVELPVGAIDASDTRLGDRLRIEPA